MEKENAYIFLSDASLEELNNSKGAIILIQYPQEIEECIHLIEELELSKQPKMTDLERVQSRYDALCHLSFRQKFGKWKEVKAEKLQKAEKLSELAREIAHIDSSIGAYRNTVTDLSFKIDEFTTALARVNLEPEDVINAYFEIKAMLEAKIEAERIASEIPEGQLKIQFPDEVESLPRKKVAEPPVAEMIVVDDSVLMASAEAQTHKTEGKKQSVPKTKEPRLSPKERFERRLAKTKEIQEQGQKQQ